MSLSDPEQRKRAIDDAIKRVMPEKKLNEKQVALMKAAEVSTEVTNQMVALLRALPSPQSFNHQGTQDLVFEAFASRFAKWNREQVLFLLSVMHTDILMKAIEARVHAGLVGPNFDAED